MPFGKGTYGHHVGRPSKSLKEAMKEQMMAKKGKQLTAAQKKKLQKK